MSTQNASLARVKIKFPSDIWISDVFSKFRDVKMRIEYFLPYNIEETIGNAVIEIFHYKIEDIVNLIKNHKSIIEFSVLENEETRVKINVKTYDPYLLYAVIKCGVLINFPVNVRDGYAYWKLISTREGIDKLLTIFEEKKITFDLLRIGNSPYNLEREEHQLSFEEEAILNKAIEHGFFEIPRKISLEDLAGLLGKSKSALSVSLRKIIKKKVLAEG